MNGLRALRYPRLTYGIATLVLLTALVPSGAEFWLGHGRLEPEGEAFGWEPMLMGVHLITNLLIGLAYVAISATLIYLARRGGRSIPFLWAFVAFGIFIISCGVTHLWLRLPCGSHSTGLRVVSCTSLQYLRWGRLS